MDFNDDKFKVPELDTFSIPLQLLFVAHKISHYLNKAKHDKVLEQYIENYVWEPEMGWKEFVEKYNAKVDIESIASIITQDANINEINVSQNIEPFEDDVLNNNKNDNSISINNLPKPLRDLKKAHDGIYYLVTISDKNKELIESKNDINKEKLEIEVTELTDKLCSHKIYCVHDVSHLTKIEKSYYTNIYTELIRSLKQLDPGSPSRFKTQHMIEWATKRMAIIYNKSKLIVALSLKRRDLKKMRSNKKDNKANQYEKHIEWESKLILSGKDPSQHKYNESTSIIKNKKYDISTQAKTILIVFGVITALLIIIGIVYQVKNNKAIHNI